MTVPGGPCVHHAHAQTGLTTPQAGTVIALDLLNNARKLPPIIHAIINLLCTMQVASAKPILTYTTAQTSETMAPRTILWFRNDLRLRDNVAVAEAAAAGGEVVPIFCFDDRFMSARNVLDRRPHGRMVGDPKMGAPRAQFQLESVNALRNALQGIGSDLLVFYDRPENVIPGLPLLQQPGHVIPPPARSSLPPCGI